MISLRIFVPLTLTLGLLLSSVEQADATRRVALVIGNDTYDELPVLQKAGADATDFAAVLKEKKFDTVILRKNLSRLQMDLAVSDFLEGIAPGDTAVFFYSGHGWSDGSQNFLVGTDVPKTAGGVALARLSIPLQNGANGIIDEMAQQGASLKIVIVDACRDNPFQPEIAGRSAGLGRGLTRVEPPNGTFVIFSAGSGQVALDRLSDSDNSRNSVFTRTFLPLIRSDLPLLDVTKTTQEKVYELARQVHHDQEPAYYDQVRGDACLSLSCEAPPKQADQSAPIVREDPGRPAVGDEIKFWIAIQNSSNPAEYKAFMDTYPDSDLTALALIRLETIEPGFWESVSSSGRKFDFDRYLNFYPDGRHADEARAGLAALAERQAAPEPEVALAEPAAAAEAEPEAAVVESAAAATPAPEAAPPEPEAAPEETEVALAEPEEAPSETDTSGNVSLSGRELIVSLQEVLKRAGCYTSRIDGLWGRRSQRGLENLLKRTSIEAKPEPTAETFVLIRDVDERVCPVVVPPKKKKRTATVPKRTRRPPAATPRTRSQPVVRRRQPEPAPEPRRRTGGNPRAGCAGVMSPADPNFGAPGDLSFGC